jgi:hypothetical protein
MVMSAMSLVLPADATGMVIGMPFVWK